jgi:hypothetical protein
VREAGRSRHRRALEAVIAALVLGMTGYGFAQTGSTAPIASGNLPLPTEKPPYWSHGEPRPFVSGRALAGLGFTRLALSAGYGKPHWSWAGLEVSAFASPFYATAQAGLHARLVLAELYVATRRTYAFQRGAVPRADSVSRSDLESAADKLHYTSLDVDLSGFLPLGRALFVWELAYIRLLGQSSTMLYFEELQRVVITKDGLLTSKLAPMLRLPIGRQTYAGALAEHLTLWGRSQTLVVRLGASLYATLSEHWDLLGFVSWPVYDHDTLGAWVGMYGSVAARYRFATQDHRTSAP